MPNYGRACGGRYLAICCVLAFTPFLVALENAVAGTPEPVLACGQLVQDGFLPGDLDCSTHTTSEAVHVLKRGTLDLRGFTLTGAAAGGTVDTAIQCRGKCRIFSSGSVGTILVGTDYAVLGEDVDSSEKPNKTTVSIANVHIDGGGAVGTAEGRLDLEGVTIENTTLRSVRGGLSVKATDCAFTNLVSGISSGHNSLRRSGKVKLTRVVMLDVGGSAVSSTQRGLILVKESSIENSGGAGLKVSAGESGAGGRGVGKIKVFRSSVLGNGGDGVGTSRATIVDSVVSGNAGFGSAGLVSVRRSAIADNGLGGIFVGGRTVVRDSAVTGNGTDAECGVARGCADIILQDASLQLPQLDDDSTCDTSYLWDSGLPGDTLGVCSLD